jgi:ribosomal protein S18 acetylase RimI-like enzyme
MNYQIRPLRKEEYPLLREFLYQAVFQRDEFVPIARTVLDDPQVTVYIDGFGEKKDDHCFCAEVDGQIVGAVWVRVIDGFGHVDDKTPEFAISLFKKYRGHGIGTELMRKMLQYLDQSGYEKSSLAVQKDNYACRMYQSVGFEIIGENKEEYILVREAK